MLWFWTMADAFEILSDCPICLVEGAVVELVDPARARGVAVVARCRLCLHELRLGSVVREGRAPGTEEEARVMLARWAQEEGEPDLERFCEGSMGGLGAAEVAARLVAREPVSTNFDVLAWLFGGMSGAAAESGPRATPEPPVSSNAGPAPDVQAPGPAPFSAARALASVLLADGSLRPGERASADRVLDRAGLPPLSDADLRLWRPMELGRPEDPGPWMAAMVRLVWSDGQRDESEWRMLRELARAWAFPISRLEALDAREAARHAPLARRAWTSLKRLFVVENP